MNLSLFVLIPVLTLVALLLSKSNKQARIVSVIGMGAQLLLSIALVFMYLAGRKGGDMSEMMFYQEKVWYSVLNFKYIVGVDGISVAMLLLTSIIVFTGIFASWTIEKMTKEFFIILIILATGVYGFFISLDLFTMFLFYELAVIPMYLLIGVWGTGRKEYSAMKLTLMLMGGSAFIMLALFGIYWHSAPEGATMTMNILEIAKYTIPVEVQRFLFPITFVGFGVLGAMFPFHTWSPDGHAAAPTAVSMLHAGVLMKLGGYGCFRVAVFLMPEAARELSWIFIILTGISVIYGAFGAILQKDLKYINAYSSVSHCGLVLFAILMLNQTAMTGAVLQMLSHGLMTALFFGLIGMIYGRTGTRMVNELGGLLKVMPFLAVCYVIAGMASLGLPGLSGFVAEMTIFVGAFQNPDLLHRVFTILACSAIVVTAVYILRVVGQILMGPVKNEKFNKLTDAAWYEKISTVGLIAAIAGIGLFPLWLSTMINDSVAPIIGRVLGML